jgi:mannose-1-phosphate guanylyltransferase/mannose-6-phosphate isomerase
VLRALAAGVTHVHVMANQGQADLLHAQWQEIAPQAGEARFVLEPMRRDSGPAIAAGVAHCLALYGAACRMLVLPCDHLIPDEKAFAAAVAQACEAAQAGYLTTFGLKPQAPVTDYGYIRAGDAVAQVPSHPLATRTVAAFVEKPDRATAQLYVDSGNYYWNSGMFLFEAGCFAKEAEHHMPALWTHAREAVEQGLQSDQGLLLGATAFAQAPSISIDYALFEKSHHVAVVPADFAWSDVGGWAAMHDALPQNPQKLALSGPVVVQDSTDSLVLSDGIPVLALGLSGMVVVATKAGVFVAPKERASEIKALLAQKPPSVA